MKLTTKALVAIATIAMTATAAQAALAYKQTQGLYTQNGGQTYVGARLNSAFAGNFGSGISGTVYGGYEVAPNVAIEGAISPTFANGVTSVGLSVTGAYRHSLQNVVQAPVYLKGKLGIGGSYTSVSSNGINASGFGGTGLVWGVGAGYDLSPDLALELDANNFGGGIGVHKKF